MIRLAERVRRRSLERWYFASADAGEVPVRRHLVWQSPLALGVASAGAVEREARLRAAGGLWLRNFDLRFAGQLWLTDRDSETTWAFRRPRLPGEQHLIVGPIALAVAGDGRRIFRTAVHYRETDDQELDALLRSFAPALPA